MSDKLSEARRLLKDTGSAITKQNHVLYEFDEWTAIDLAVAKLEKEIENLQRLLYESHEQGGIESTWVQVDHKTQRLWPISEDEAMAKAQKEQTNA